MQHPSINSHLLNLQLILVPKANLSHVLNFALIHVVYPGMLHRIPQTRHEKQLDPLMKVD
ncbi:hypothetical protein [Nostoc sp.]|uniref:hypothetical protein n=1 Tax=Nostoc sp. TaxID=1180 RepID=UPI0035948B28